MRGSVYFQTATLAKYIFCEGAKKTQKTDKKSEHYQKVSSYKTMESYRNIWNNFLNYLKEHWSIKDCEKISSEHIVAYMDYKIEYYPSKQYLEKISAALGKLEIALHLFVKSTYGEKRNYDFSIRQHILNEARDLKYVVDNYRNRAYKNPKTLIKNLQNPIHQLAATIQLEGGARIEGIAFIKPFQLLDTKIDKITGITKGVLFTKEKGGKEGEILISLKCYHQLLTYLTHHSSFKISRQAYYTDLKQAALLSNDVSEASHGLRWNFAKRRMVEYAKAGYTYQESLQQVSCEMKHNRAKITEHYLG